MPVTTALMPFCLITRVNDDDPTHFLAAGVHVSVCLCTRVCVCWGKTCACRQLFECLMFGLPVDATRAAEKERANTIPSLGTHEQVKRKVSLTTAH